KIRTLELNQRTIGAFKVVERALRSEVPQKIDQSANARTAFSISTRRNHQKTLVGIRRFLVTLRSRGCLAEIKDIIGLVRIDRDGATQSQDARESSVLVIVDHGQTRDGDGFVF